jgi:hypothetical protein
MDPLETRYLLQHFQASVMSKYMRTVDCVECGSHTVNQAGKEAGLRNSSYLEMPRFRDRRMHTLTDINVSLAGLSETGSLNSRRGPRHNYA